MGAGASTAVDAAKGASDAELAAAVAALSAEDRARLLKAAQPSFEAVYGGACAPGVKKLEEWIQVGCGDKPYYCEEKKATFGVDKDGNAIAVDTLPDFKNHNNFMAEFFR